MKAYRIIFAGVLLLALVIPLSAEQEIRGRSSAYMRSADLYVTQNLLEKAEENYLKVLKRYPDYIPALRGLMKIYYQWGTDAKEDPKEGIAHYMKADEYGSGLIKAMENPENHPIDGEELAEHKEWVDDAEKTRQSIRARIYNAGLEAYKAGNVEDAEWILNQLIELDPEYENAYTLISKVYEEQGDPDKAISMLKKAAEKQPSNASLRRVIATMYYEKQDFQNTILWYNKAVEADPQDSRTYFNMAVVYNEMQDVDGAIGALEKVLEIEPDDFEALQNLIELYREKGDNEKSLFYLRALVDKQEGNPEYAEDYRTNLEIFCHRLYAASKFDTLKVYAEKLVQLDPENETNKKMLEHAKSMSGNKK